MGEWKIIENGNCNDCAPTTENKKNEQTKRMKVSIGINRNSEKWNNGDFSIFAQQFLKFKAIHFA